MADDSVSVTQLQAELERLRAENQALRAHDACRERALAEALRDRTATREILRVIAASPTDLQRVLEALALSVSRLCQVRDVIIWKADGNLLRELCHLGAAAGRLAAARPTTPLTRGSVVGRSIIDRVTIHEPDYQAAVEREFPDSRPGVEAGMHAALAVPLIREGVAIGALGIGRVEVGPFSARQIALVETFADQAVIAIENARLFQELQEANRELEEASRHKSRFLANMSHELRTPLNSIIGFSGVLAEQMFGELNDRQIEYVRDIQTSGQYLLSLINDILDLSKVEAGRMELDVRTISLRETLEHGLVMFEERAMRHAISVGLELDPGLDEIEADERKLKQVIFNLVSNAVKFTPDGGRVELRARRIDDEVQIDVTDTGEGIAPGDLDHLFDDFRQVGRGGSNNEDGTGLGLAISRRFCRLMGGDLTVTSTYGMGSTFTVRLPARMAALLAPE